MQTTLLGLAIAFIIALMAALIGPYYIDWNQFRPQFEAQATQVIGAPVHVSGELDARLLPTPSLRLRSVVVGGANDLGRIRADKLDVQFSLGSLMRGEWRADELTINGLSLDLGLDSKGRVDAPATTGKFNLGTLSIDRLNLTGRIALHDAASHSTLELNDIAFSGDVRSLAGAVRGDGNFKLNGVRYPFRVSSGLGADGSGTRLHLNIDPAARAFSADLDGMLTFEGRTPHFDGALVLAVPAGLKAKDGVPITPWKIAAKIKAEPAAARLDQIDASYGSDENALRFSGLGDIRLGAAPLLHAVMSARQLDVDKFAAKDNAAEPLQLLPALRMLFADIPPAPIPAQIEISSEQIMLGGRPVQNLAAEVASDNGSWRIDRLDFRAPGATLVSLTGSNAQAGPFGGFGGTLGIESTDPDALVAWLQGRSEVSYRSQKPLKVHGDVSVAADRFAIDAMTAEIDGGTVAGRVSLSMAPAGSRLDAELKGDRLDLDAAVAFARSLAGPQGEWPVSAKLSLDLGGAVSAGQELRPFVARVGYSPDTVSIDQLRIGQASGVVLEGVGDFDRVNATGKLTLNSSAASLHQITAQIAPFAPALAARLDSLGSSAGPARLNLALGVDKNAQHADRANARAVFDLVSPQLKGTATITATPEKAALRGIDLDALRRSEFSVESKLSSDQGRTLLTLLGLDRVIASSEGPAQFEGSVSGVWHAPLRLKARLSGGGLDANAQGTAEPWAQDAKASVSLNIRRASLAPLFDLKPTDALAQNISLSSRVALNGNRLSFDDLDSTIAGSRLRGRLAMTLDGERNVDGEVGLDALDLEPVLALAIGAAGRDATEPLGAGLTKGWRGRIAFEALRGMLPDGVELRPVSGVVKSDGESLSFDAIKGGLGGGEATANLDLRQGANGIALNARVQLSGVDGTALHYRGLAMPAGRVAMVMTLASQGRSASALTGALSGSGTVTLDSARLKGLDPRAFDVAIRASDSGQATNDAKLRQIVEPALSAGSLSVKSAQIPFTIGDGRLRVGATTLEADGARAIISGGYDIPADQADIRITLASTAAGQAASRPEIQLFAAGSPDKLDRSVDVASLSSWLAVRAIDRETRRLDSIERGEPPPPLLPASIPPPSASSPTAAVPDAAASDLRRLLPKLKPVAPRPPAAAAPLAPNAPVASQQLAPLPPPIEVRPAPGSVIARPPRPKPPLVLTPPATVPAPR